MKRICNERNWTRFRIERVFNGIHCRLFSLVTISFKFQTNFIYFIISDNSLDVDVANLSCPSFYLTNFIYVSIVA